MKLRTPRKSTRATPRKTPRKNAVKRPSSTRRTKRNVRHADFVDSLMGNFHDGGPSTASDHDWISHMASAHHEPVAQSSGDVFDLVGDYDAHHGARARGTPQAVAGPGFTMQTPAHRHAHHVIAPMKVLENSSAAGIEAAFKKLSKGDLHSIISSVRPVQGETKNELVQEMVQLFKESLNESCRSLLAKGAPSHAQLKRFAVSLDPALGTKSPEELCTFFHQNSGIVGKISLLGRQLAGGAKHIVKNMLGMGSAALEARMQKTLAPIIQQIMDTADQIASSSSDAVKSAVGTAAAACKRDSGACYIALSALQHQFCKTADMELAPFCVKLNSLVADFIVATGPKFAPSAVGGLAVRIIAALAAKHKILIPVDLQAGFTPNIIKHIMGRITEDAAIIEKAITDHTVLCIQLGGDKQKAKADEQTQLQQFRSNPRGFLSGVH